MVSLFFTKIWTCWLSGMSMCTTVRLFLLQHTEIEISKQVSNFLKRIRWEFLKIGCANIRLPGILFFSWFFENIYRLQWGIDTRHLKVLSFSTLLQFFVLQPCFDFFYIISSCCLFANAKWQNKFLIFEFVYSSISQFQLCLAPTPLPRLTPQALAFFLPLMANSQGWGLLSCQIPRCGDEKTGQMPCPPTALQHFSLTALSNSVILSILMCDFLFQLTSSFVIALGF